MVKRQALVVGVSRYERESRLLASAEDARRLTTLLQRNDVGQNWAITPLFDLDDQPRILADDLRAQLGRLLGELSAGHEVLFYFAGHARPTAWGAELLAYDGPALSFNDLMALVDRSPAATVTIMLDCCMSGGAGIVAVPDTHGVKLDRALLREGITVLTASRSGEEAEETPLHGLFTQQLLDGLDGTAAGLNGEITAMGLYSHAVAGIPDGRQQPTIKAHTVHPTVIRQVAPRVDADRLEHIVTLFPLPTTKIRLDMHHEGEPDDDGFVDRMEPPGAYCRFKDGSARQKDLDHLKEWRDVGLVESSDGKDFYSLCKYGGEGRVVLTPLGRFYRQLVKNNELPF